jgi:hypothetical protein
MMRKVAETSVKSNILMLHLAQERHKIPTIKNAGWFADVTLAGL